MRPGYGACLIVISDSFDASAIAATWFLNSLAFSLLTDATAPRQPEVRRGPTRWPSANTAQIADLEFFRATAKALSCAPYPALRKSSAKAGSAIG